MKTREVFIDGMKSFVSKVLAMKWKLWKLLVTRSLAGGPLDFVLRALRALRSCDPRVDIMELPGHLNDWQSYLENKYDKP